jgi:hypothetical protein
VLIGIEARDRVAETVVSQSADSTWGGSVKVTHS